MGWKAIKNHYGIGHIVQVSPLGRILIGSAFIQDLIAIDREKKVVETGKLGIGGSNELRRIWDEIHGDLDQLWSLAEQEDSFEAALPVFTYADGAILELSCEARGYPHVTHCGRLMYDNQFFDNRIDAIAFGKKDAELSVKAAGNQVTMLQAQLTEALALKAKEEANLAAMSAL